MPNPSKQKGDRLEREVVKALNDMGIISERVPLSGAAGGQFSGDVFFRLLRPFETRWGEKFEGFEDYVFECKSRKAGFKTLYNWLDGKDGLVLKADRKERLYVLPEKTLKALIG